MFDELSCGSHPPTVKDVAEHWQLPYETVRRHWSAYKAAVATGDDTAIAIACGDADGRRDNHRVFSRDEEQLLRERIDQENIDPNKPMIQRLALSIHHQQQLSSTPASSTRSHARPTDSFSASSGFVERIKHDLHLSSQQPGIEKKYKRKRRPEDDEERLTMAINFIDVVLAPAGTERPPVIHSK